MFLISNLGQRLLRRVCVYQQCKFPYHNAFKRIETFITCCLTWGWAVSCATPPYVTHAADDPGRRCILGGDDGRPFRTHTVHHVSQLLHTGPEQRLIWSNFDGQHIKVTAVVTACPRVMLIIIVSCPYLPISQHWVGVDDVLHPSTTSRA